MRPMGVVPAHEERKLAAHRSAPERNQDAPRALVLQCSEEPLDDGDAAMLAHGPIAQPDLSSPTPASISSRLEHAFLVAQQVARRRADVPDRPTEESAQRSGIRLVAENHPSLNPPRVVVQNHDNPPTEGPLLWHRGRSSRLADRTSSGMSISRPFRQGSASGPRGARTLCRRRGPSAGGLSWHSTITLAVFRAG